MKIFPDKVGKERRLLVMGEKRRKALVCSQDSGLFENLFPSIFFSSFT